LDHARQVRNAADVLRLELSELKWTVRETSAGLEFDRHEEGSVR
jgi:hypothetical protein